VSGASSRSRRAERRCSMNSRRAIVTAQGATLAPRR
jgi:hypothetical protein